VCLSGLNLLHFKRACKQQQLCLFSLFSLGSVKKKFYSPLSPLLNLSSYKRTFNTFTMYRLLVELVKISGWEWEY